MCSRFTTIKSSACKTAIEDHYSKLFYWLNARAERKNILEQRMEDKELTEEQKQKKRKDLSLLETKYLRERRIKINKDCFETLRIIGRGGFGEVSLVRLKNTDRIFAMKVMKKEKLLQRKQENHVNSERNALAYVSELYTQNPWVIKLYYSFQDEESLYLVMEYLAGGDLMHKLIEIDVFTLHQTRFYIAELVCAIESIHELGFIHRDVKPDNILLDSTGHIKLTDFGLCTGYMAKKSWTLANNENVNYIHYYHNLSEEAEDNNNNDPTTNPEDMPSEAPFHNSNVRFNSWKKKRKFMAYSAVGTADYIAPETLTENGYSKECDWWSVGVIMFEMLAGGPPFSSNSPMQTRKNVINYKHILASGWQVKELRKFDPSARDLILRFLSPSAIRIGSQGIEEIKNHPFFTGIDWDNIRSTTPPFLPDLLGPTDSRNFPSDEIMAEEQTILSPTPSPSASLTLAEQEEYNRLKEECDRLVKMEKFIGFTYKSSLHFSDAFIPLSL